MKEMPAWRLFSSLRSAKMRHPSMTKLGFRFIVTNCRAVILPRFGGPEVLEIRPYVKVPDLKPHDVLVRTRAVSINPLDTRMRSGYGRSIFEPLLPLILGRDISGEVASVGNSVRSLSVGQDVFGALHPTAVRGTYADYAILAEDELMPKPSSVSHVDASAIPFAALTAWRALKSTARIAEGQRLLVIGGGGAVGLSAIQLAVAAGCHVSTTCGDQSIDQVLAAGAEQAIDYTLEDVESAIKGQFNAVLDTIGVPETERVGINLLKRGGHYMTLQGEAASISDSYGVAVGIPLSTAILLKKQIQYRYSHGIGLEICVLIFKSFSSYRRIQNYINFNLKQTRYCVLELVSSDSTSFSNPCMGNWFLLVLPPKFHLCVECMAPLFSLVDQPEDILLS